MVRLNNKNPLPRAYKKSILYHDIFNYPLKKAELELWSVGSKVKTTKFHKNIVFKKGFYFLEGKEGNIRKRIENEKFSKKKIKIAKRATSILGKIPWVLMVGVTGSLAMSNASDSSDIDLMFIVNPGTLWTTRIIANILLLIFGFSIRRRGGEEEKDKLCLNIWLDETVLLWQKKNIFTAHEIAQIIPLINKNETYERFVWQNRWILGFWPNAIQVKKTERYFSFWNFGIVEEIFFKLQYLYMRGRITNENISSNHALFHPVDLSGKIRI